MLYIAYPYPYTRCDTNRLAQTWEQCDCQVSTLNTGTVGRSRSNSRSNMDTKLFRKMHDPIISETEFTDIWWHTRQHTRRHTRWHTVRIHIINEIYIFSHCLTYCLVWDSKNCWNEHAVTFYMVLMKFNHFWEYNKSDTNIKKEHARNRSDVNLGIWDIPGSTFRRKK